MKVQDFRVLELNRTLARQLLAEKVDLITKGADSVIHQYNERRKLMEQQEKQARVKLHENRMRRKNDWNSGFGKKFQRDRSFGNDDRGRRDGYNNSDNFQKKSKTSRVDDWLDDFWEKFQIIFVFNKFSKLIKTLFWLSLNNMHLKQAAHKLEPALLIDKTRKFGYCDFQRINYRGQRISLGGTLWWTIGFWLWGEKVVLLAGKTCVFHRKE